MEACLFKEPVRNDIIKEYTDYLHEKICEDLKNYWDKNHEKTSVNSNTLSILFSKMIKLEREINMQVE